MPVPVKVMVNGVRQHRFGSPAAPQWQKPLQRDAV